VAAPARDPGPTRDEGTVMVWHRIVDGDSLPELAERYLGDRQRYRELFEFNRDVLASPDVLPIGQKIKVPFRGPSRQP
jgi:nucleoid-associated protein YgaU